MVMLQTRSDEEKALSRRTCCGHASTTGRHASSFFINAAEMMAGLHAAHPLKQLTVERLPCSESVEMVEPMLSVRIRSTDPDTESCSRRRLR